MSDSSVLSHGPSPRIALIAHSIADDIRHGSLANGEHLREQLLADRFGVSRTPVRAALQLLERQQIVESRPRRGYYVSGLRGGALRNLPLTPDDALYERITRAHFLGSLDTAVNETELMRRFGVSRPALLRVLAQLLDEGLVARGSMRRWTFRPILNSPHDFAESYRFRLALEPGAFDMPTWQVRPDVLETMLGRHAALLQEGGHISKADAFDLDAGFHEMIAGFSGNRFLLQSIRQQNRLRRLAEYEGYADRVRLMQWLREHLCILEAVAAGNRKEAKRLLRRHLEAARRHGPLFPTPSTPVGPDS